MRRAPLRLVLNRVEGIDRKTTAFMDATTLIRTNGLACLNTLVQSRKVYEQFSKDAGIMGHVGTDPAKQEQVRKTRKNIADLIEDIIQAINELNPELEKSE